MSLVDVGIALFALALAWLGWRRGLLASVLCLAGFLVGAAVGARLGPMLLPDGADSSYAPMVAVLAGVLLGAFLAVAVDGISRRLHGRLRGAARALDGVGGAVLLGLLGLLIAWGVGAVALHAEGADGLRRAMQRSAILGALNDAMPPSGALLHVLRRVDPRESVRGPDADVRRPDPATIDDPNVRGAGGSAVRVLGTACGLGVEGSGWVAGPGLVVTNAHVVAGQQDTTVGVEGGDRLPAQAVHYDSRNDLAILAAPGLTAPALDLAGGAPKGADAAVIGFPENGPLTVEPARLGRTGTVTSEDSYGRGPVQRRMTPFRARVRSGNSGGPVVDRQGDVVATVFASSKDAQRETGLGVPNGVVARALSGRLKPTGTGPCAA